MKDRANLIKFRKRRIQSGKNARLYGSILYIATVIVYFIIQDEDVEVFSLLPLFIFFFFYDDSINLIATGYGEKKTKRTIEK